MPPTIAVLGTLTRDTTTYANGVVSENLGGLVYSLSTLAALFAGQARILPVANVGSDLYLRVLAALDLPGIDPSLLCRVPVPNNHVHLTYRDAATRDEILVGLVPPVSIEQAREARNADWFLVNLTSGRDIELETLQSLRREVRGTLMLDVHSLTLEILPGGRRALRRPERWREWVRAADWVQMNETEAQLLGESQERAALARTILNLGPRGVLVTLGARGCFGMWREEGAVRELGLPAATAPEPPYPTGCGDVFGATFAYAMLSDASIEAAIRLANGVASTKACFEPQAALGELRFHAAEHLRRCFGPDAAPR
jgi:sugar/nucleoside kinase (ribokinase family)